MADRSGIEWTDATWNWGYGCSHESPGCKNCYAELQTHRVASAHDRYRHLTVLTRRGPKWSGEIELVPERLDQPIRWQKPRMVFVNSMSDIFHPKMPESAIAATFAVMGACRRHTFQMLTKRSGLMKEWFAKMRRDHGDPWSILEHCEAAAREYGVDCRASPASWPLRNVWMGVTVEDRKRKFRMDDLRGTPAAVRFVSAEPLLEDLGDLDLRGIQWMIVGGESGHNARPMRAAWARSIRDQCLEEGVALFMKQWGEHDADGVKHRSKKETGCELDGVDWKQWPKAA